MITIEYGTPLSPRDLAAIEEMDHLVYGPGIFTSPGHSRARLDRCPDFFVTAKQDGGRLAGAWSTYPVDARLWERALVTEHILDDDVGPEWIITPRPGEETDLMAFDLVAHPDFRGQGLARRLLEGYRALLRDKMAEGYRFQRLFGYVVTPMGYHMMLRYGAHMVRRVQEGVLFSIDPQQLIVRGAVEGPLPDPPAGLELTGTQSI